MPKDPQEDTSRFVPFGIIRTSEQIAIQTHTSKILLIEANAGAAKTTTLALRIGEAIARGIAPEAILALVFTDAARDVMRQRLIELGVPNPTVKKVAISTFEEFARTHLQPTDDWRVPYFPHARQQFGTMLDAIQAVYEQYGHLQDEYDFWLNLESHALAVTQYLDAQLRLKAKMALPDAVDLEQLFDVFQRLGVTATEFLVAFEYERRRIGNHSTPNFRGLFDATYDLARDLERGDERYTKFSDYRLVVCDELHDLNEAAFRIVCDIVDRPHCKFVGAGDRDQVIYATLGASHDFLSSRFERRFYQIKRLPLTVTHRHGSHLAFAMGEFKRKKIESDVPDRFEVKIATYVDPSECAKRVVESIDKALREGFKADGCAVLMRDRHHSVEIENALREAGIAYRTPVMGSYLQREEILFLRAVMAIALHDLSAVCRDDVKKAMVEALDLYGGLRIPHKELEELKKGVSQHNGIHWVHELAIRPKPGEQSSTLDLAVQFVIQAGGDSKAADTLKEVCELMNLQKLAQRLYVRPYDASIVVKSIDGFLAIAGTQTLAEFSASINEAERFAVRNWDKNVVTLDCVATSKGREFDHVILPFVAVDEYPTGLMPLKDEENLFYVGATRAKRRLTLITPEDGERRSPFIKRMNLSGIAAKANLAQDRAESAFRKAPATRHYLRVPYDERDRAKELGAKWDATRKKWYVPTGIDLKPFEQWF